MMRILHRSFSRLTEAKGFSLFELSIVLIIVSVTVGSVFAIANRSNAQSKIDITNERLDAIENALYAYRVANNRLPCPADGTMKPDNVLYGVEAVNPEPTNPTCTGGSPAANFTGSRHASLRNDSGILILIRVVGGMVPVASLGLPKHYALDGFGNKISYHIDAQATEDNAFSIYTASNGKCFNVMIDDEKTFSADGDNNYIALHAVYALISHGADGHGAFTPGGTRINRGSTNSFQNTNANYNSSGVAMTYTNQFFQLKHSVDPTNPLNVFDDYVRFKTRAALRSPQDSPSLDFPDLVASSTSASGNGTHFYYRCKDRFHMEQPELVDNRNLVNQDISIAARNEFIAAATSPKYFEIWRYDGLKTLLLPDSGFSPARSSTYSAQSINWARDNSFFIASSLDSAADALNCNLSTGCNRIRVYERTGLANFISKDKAIENATMTAEILGVTLSVLALNGNAPLTSLSPDDSQLIVYNGNGQRGEPLLYRRNSDNSFSNMANAFDPPIGVISTRKPVWSPDMNYLFFPGYSTGAAGAAETMLYRYEGNFRYSKVPSPGSIITTAQPLNEAHNSTSGAAYTAAFSPNGRFLATGSASASWFKVYEQKAGDVWERVPPANINGYIAYLNSITKHFYGKTNGPTRVEALDFSPDGRYLAVGLAATNDPWKRLHIFRIDGNKFTLLSNETVSGVYFYRGTLPDVVSLGDRSVTSVKWRKLMPWEESK